MIVFSMRPANRDYEKRADVLAAWNADEVFEISFCENMHFIGERFRQSELVNGSSVKLWYAAGTKRMITKVRSENH